MPFHADAKFDQHWAFKEKGPERPKDENLLQGTWRVVGVAYTNQTDKERKNWETSPLTVQFFGDTFVNWSKNEATFRLDPSNSPKRMSLVRTKPGGDVRWVAIYELNGDDLKLCVSDDTDHYPEGFDVKVTKPGTSMVSVILKRVPAAKVADELLGAWRLVDVVTPDTHIAHPENLWGERKATWKFGADVVATSWYDAKYTLDPTAKPKRMKWFLPIADPTGGKGLQRYAIYELKGDDLKICIGDDTYPEDFLGPRGTVFILKRIQSAQAAGDGKPTAAAGDVAEGGTGIAEIERQLRDLDVQIRQVEKDKVQLDGRLEQLATMRATLLARKLRAETDSAARTNALLDAKAALEKAAKGLPSDKALKTLDEVEKLIQQMKKDLKDK